MELTVGTKTTCVPCGNCPYDKLVSVTLSDEWTKIEAVFKANIEYPTGVTNNSPDLCNYFFSGDLNNLLGVGYSCGITTTTLTVNLGTEAAFLSSSSLPMNAGRLKVPPCTCGYNTPISVTNAVPFSLTAVVPSVVSSHTICTPLTISESGFVGLGKRPSTLTVAYSILDAYSIDLPYPRTGSFGKSKGKLNSFLASQTQTSVTFAAYAFINSGSYKLQIVLTNFGAKATYTVIITTSGYTVPTLSLSGISTSPKSIHEWDSLCLLPLITTPGCDPANVDQAYSYNWTQLVATGIDVFNDTALQEMYSLSDGVLTFQPYTLLPEHTYSFFLNLTHVDYPVLLNTSIDVRVVRSSVFFRA